MRLSARGQKKRMLRRSCVVSSQVVHSRRSASRPSSALAVVAVRATGLTILLPGVYGRLDFDTPSRSKPVRVPVADGQLEGGSWGDGAAVVLIHGGAPGVWGELPVLL